RPRAPARPACNRSRRADDRARPGRRPRAQAHDRRAGARGQDRLADHPLPVRGGRPLRPNRGHRQGRDRGHRDTRGLEKRRRRPDRDRDGGLRCARRRDPTASRRSRRHVRRRGGPRARAAPARPGAAGLRAHAAAARPPRRRPGRPRHGAGAHARGRLREPGDGELMRIARLLAVCWWFQLKQMTKAGLFVFTSIIEPLIFATMAYYLFKAGHRPGTLLYASLSAGLMGIWTSTLFGSGGVISWQRWQGTLEPLVAAPPPMILIIFPLTIATATIGLYSLGGTLLYGRIVFGIPLDLVHPVWFVITIPVTIVALGALGLVIGSSFILYRNANALANMLEFPVWLVTGAIVPLS